jgi:UDP-glucose 4-epimerase
VSSRFAVGAGGKNARMRLTVAVTGPTGEIGKAAVTALEHEPAVEKIVGMARRPFDPSTLGWTKTVYQQGDILDREAVDALVADADVVVHLAFIIMGSREESARINLQGTRRAPEMSSRPRCPPGGRGAWCTPHRSQPTAITPTTRLRLPRTWRRADRRNTITPSKRQHAKPLWPKSRWLLARGFILRPCIVAGPRATALADPMPWNQLPAPVRAVAGAVPVLKPVVPDPGYPLQESVTVTPSAAPTGVRPESPKRVTWGCYVGRAGLEPATNGLMPHRSQWLPIIPYLFVHQPITVLVSRPSPAAPAR